MAWYPCAVGTHKYVGQQQSIYFGIVNGMTSHRSKLRLCPQHFDTIAIGVESRMHEVAQEDVAENTSPFEDRSCNWCDREESPWAMFATLYPRKAEQRAFFAPVCDGCLPTAATMAQIGL